VIRRFLPIAALLAVVSIPLAVRPAATATTGAPGGETLVVISPHDQAIRWEFTHAFVRAMAARGRSVQIDWRTPGGAGEIARVLASDYTAGFEVYWTQALRRPWSPLVASTFALPCPREAPCDPLAAQAHQTFLDSNVGCGIDVLFGAGGVDAAAHALAGRLVSVGIERRHPEIFGDGGVPPSLGGEPYRDSEGRWFGTNLSGFGICYNGDGLARLKIATPPDSWSALADPKYFGQLALADPSKSGSALKAFEMLIQEQLSLAHQESGDKEPPRPLDDPAVARGWVTAMRLIQRIAANARYFSDAASSIPVDVAMGNAAAGMCLDSYGKFESEVTDDIGARGRMGFVLPRSGTSVGADSIGILRGAPHPELAAEFVEFVLSEAGQKLWSFRRGAPGGPERRALHRLPILPALYDERYEAFRSDPATLPYAQRARFVYHGAWTEPIFRDIAFVIRVMCVDPSPELGDAFGALIDASFPGDATAVFEDVSAVDYATVRGRVHATLRSGDASAEMALVDDLVRHFRDQYLRAAAIARTKKRHAGSGG
jgi:ABC-type Fe3+ transport system substrate-binding protein